MSRRIIQSELRAQSFLVGILSIGLSACGGGGGGSVSPSNGGGNALDPGTPDAEDGSGLGDTPAVSGYAVKGPMQNARVFIDTDGNGVHGSNDSPVVITDGDGAFLIEAGYEGNLIVEATADTIDTFARNMSLDGLVLKAPPGYSIVSPLTTLTSAILESNQNLLPAEAEIRIKNALDIGDVDLATFNPFDDINSQSAQIYEKKAQQILSIANSVSQLTVSGGGSKSLSLSNTLGSIAEIININIENDPLSATDLASGSIIGDIFEELKNPQSEYYVAAFAEKVGLLGDSAIQSMKNVIVVLNTAINDIEDVSLSGEKLAKIQNIVASEASKVSDGVETTVTSIDSIDSYILVAGTKTLEVDENGTLTRETTLKITDPNTLDDTSYVFSSTPIFLSGQIIGGNSILTPSGTLSITSAGLISFSVDAADVEFLGEGQILLQNYLIKVLDSDGNEVAKEVVRVALNGANDAPIITSDSSISVVEGLAPDVTILQLEAIDAEGDAITFELTGDDASAFNLHPETYQLSFMASPDYESKSSYALDVKATDSNGAFSLSSLVVSVIDAENFLSLVTTNDGLDYTTTVTLDFANVAEVKSDVDLADGLTGFVVGLEAVQGWDFITGKNGGAIGQWKSALTGDNIEIQTALDILGQTTFRVAVLSNDGSNIAGSENKLTLGSLSYTVAQGVEDFDLTITNSYISTYDPLVRVDAVDYTVDII